MLSNLMIRLTMPKDKEYKDMIIEGKRLENIRDLNSLKDSYKNKIINDSKVFSKEIYEGLVKYESKNLKIMRFDVPSNRYQDLRCYLIRAIYKKYDGAKDEPGTILEARIDFFEELPFNLRNSEMDLPFPIDKFDYFKSLSVSALKDAKYKISLE